MEFYVVLIIIAVVVLICILTYVGMNMNSTTTVAIFPPDRLVCPDYWVQDTKGRCIAGTTNMGNFKTGFSMDPVKLNDKGMSVICAQRKWANSNNVIWSGVDNYNKC